MNKVTYIFLSYGRSTAIHQQTLAAICSFLHAKREAADSYAIRLYTEMPEFYTLVQGQVELVRLSAAQVQGWMGPSKFHLRVKPCLLIEAARSCSGPMVFLDSDMLILDSLGSMESELLDGACYLQHKEYLVASRSTKERREYMQRLAGIDLGAGVALDENSWMWNSGVIGLPPQHFERLDLVLAAVDRMVELGLSPRTRLKEQLAFSLHLAATGRLQGLSDEVIHYWGNKPEWMLLLERWVLSLVGQGLDAYEAGRWIVESGPFPPVEAPQKTKSEKRKAKLRKLLGLN